MKERRTRRPARSRNRDSAGKSALSLYGALAVVLFIVTLGGAWWTWRADNKIDRDLGLGTTIILGLTAATFLFLEIRFRITRRRTREMERRFPDEAWRRWHGWATASIPNQAHRRLQWLWAFVVGFGVLICGYLADLAARESFHRHHPIAFWTMAAIPAAALAYAANAQWIWRRYGRCHFHMDAFPAGLGQTLSGRLLMPQWLNAKDGFKARLCLVKRYWKESRGTGRYPATRSIEEETLWTEEQQVWQQAPLQAGSAGIAVSFDLPTGQPLSTFDPWDTGWVWRVEFRASIPGVNFFAQFPIPVVENEFANSQNQTRGARSA